MIVFGNSLHQNEYQIIKSGFENGLSKEQIANVFQNQEALLDIGVSPFEAIQQYTGPKENVIAASFYTNCELIPDPSELDPDAILESRTKKKPIILEVVTTTVIQYSYLKIISDYLDKVYEKTVTF